VRLAPRPALVVAEAARLILDLVELLDDRDEVRGPRVLLERLDEVAAQVSHAAHQEHGLFLRKVRFPEYASPCR